jgi:hypothetical protein
LNASEVRHFTSFESAVSNWAQASVRQNFLSEAIVTKPLLPQSISADRTFCSNYLMRVLLNGKEYSNFSYGSELFTLKVFRSFYVVFTTAFATGLLSSSSF